MKNITRFLLATVAALALAVLPAQAQLGSDAFTPVRNLGFQFPNGGYVTNLVQGTHQTNGPIDLGPFQGKGYVTINVMVTNATTGTLTAQLYSSYDLTNMTAISNYSVVSNTTSYVITNSSYASGQSYLILSGTNAAATNYVYLPATGITTPTASSAGFATPYLSPLAYTNTGAFGCTTLGTYYVPFNVKDQNRYLYIVFSPSATTGTNFMVSATFTAYPY